MWRYQSNFCKQMKLLSTSIQQNKSAEAKDGDINDSLILHGKYESTGREFKTSHPREYVDVCTGGTISSL